MMMAKGQLQISVTNRKIIHIETNTFWYLKVTDFSSVWVTSRKTYTYILIFSDTNSSHIHTERERDRKTDRVRKTEANTKMYSYLNKLDKQIIDI